MSFAHNRRESIGFRNNRVHVYAEEDSASDPEKRRNSLDTTSNAPVTSSSQKRLVSYAGAVIGLEHYLLKKPNSGLDNIAACEFSVVGHMDVTMLAAMTAVDKRFHRVLARNFIKGLLDGVRDMIPMLW